MADILRYRIIDLSHDIEDKMTVYIGDPSPQIKRVKTIKRDGVNLSTVFLGTHTGTHVDAPIHFIENGYGMDELPLDAIIGYADVLDFSRIPAGSGIGERELKSYSSLIREGHIAVLFTGLSEHWDEQKYRRNFTYLEPEGAEWLVKKKVKAVAIDYLSIEKFRSKDHVTHKILLSNNIPIIESLNSNVKMLIGKEPMMICLPLKLKGADGSPARVIALL